MEVCKRYLVVEMTKIKDGIYIPSEETKRVIHETKELYNKRRSAGSLSCCAWRYDRRRKGCGFALQ